MEFLQRTIEALGVVTVTFNYYPGAHWDCELRTITGLRATSDPFRNMEEALDAAARQLEKDFCRCAMEGRR